MIFEIWLFISLLVFLLSGFLKNPWLGLLGIGSFIFLLISKLWSTRALNDLIFKRKFHYHRGFPGETTEVRFLIENNKNLPLNWVRISDFWPDQIHFVSEPEFKASHIRGYKRYNHHVSLKWFERISRKNRIQFTSRGVYPIGPTEIITGDPFGLNEVSVKYDKYDYLTVFPDLLPVETVDFASQNPIGDLNSRKQLFEDPNRIIGVRPYQPNDSFRRIHWSATAKTGDLQVKIFQPVVSKNVVICLNVASSERAWLGSDTEITEILIKYAATLCYEYCQKKLAVGMISNASMANSDQPLRIMPSHSPNQLVQLLEALARITVLTPTPFEVFLSESLPSLPYGTSLIIITSYISDSLAETLLRIKRYKQNTTLLGIMDKPVPDLPGLNVHHIPLAELKKKDQNG